MFRPLPDLLAALVLVTGSVVFTAFASLF